MVEFYRPERLLYEAARAFLPADPIGVAEYAARYRWVNGARSGLWDNATAPYLVEPMEAWTDPRYLTIALVGPGQCGKTAVAENALLRTIDIDPGPFGWYLNTEEVARSYVKDKINPLIAAHKHIVDKQGRGATDESLSFKRFVGMAVQFLTAAPSALINRTFRYFVADEYDNWDAALGDPLTQLNVRRQTYGHESKGLILSHPDRARGSSPEKWDAGIMSVYRDSTRCTWWWPCAQCGAWCSPNPGTARQCTLAFPEDATPEQARAEAYMLCPVNGCILGEEDRLGMIPLGRWVGAGQAIDEAGVVTGERIASDVAGFWIVGLMSPFLLSGMGGLAASLVSARRKAEQGDAKALAEVLSKQLGFTPDAPVRKIQGIDAETLAQRAEPGLKLGEVPEGVRFLAVSIDVQNNRFERLVRGFGPGGESWVVDVAAIEATPATDPDDWDDVLQGALEAEFPLADGSGRVMRPKVVGFDTGGADGVTEQAYDAWRRLRRRRPELVKRLGQVGGRDAWTLLPMKGASSLNAAPLTVTYPDLARKDRRAAARGEIPVAMFNGNLAKDALAMQLQRAEPGGMAVHFPAGLAPEWYAQLVAEERNAKGAWVKIAARNEALDLMVMAAIAARVHGLQRMDWNKPPAWAAEWDRNALVGMPRAGDGAGLREPASAGVQQQRAAAVAPPPPAAAAQMPAGRARLFSRMA